MLELHNISLSVLRDGENQSLLENIHFSVPSGHLLAIVGPSGCGKTTLMKTIAGLKEEDTGEILWQGRNLAEDGDLHPSELGYVPQFSIAHELLTIEECVTSAITLRTRQNDDESATALLDQTLKSTGLTALRDRQVKILSGGQKRRLGLALEIVTQPTLLLCDEVTSGLDPKSEREITQLLHDLARADRNRIVINVTHNLGNLSLYDTVLVLHEGRVIYHGPPRALAHYFSVEHAEDIYPKLARRSAERWADSWDRHRDAYYATYELAPPGTLEPIDKPKIVSDREPGKISLPKAKAPSIEDDEDSQSPPPVEPQETKPHHKRKHHRHEVDEAHELPGFLTQTIELLTRRWTIFWRDRSQLWLQLAMLLGFPLLVVIFGFEGIPQVRTLSQRADANFIVEAQERSAHLQSQLNAGGLVSGLILMQIVLVTLMASNNAAREIASERDILERERLGGLSSSAYITSKVLFLGGFVVAQTVWMGLFVELLCHGIPGSLLIKLLLLLLSSAAMSAICLGISALMRTPEKATILSIYLVGFQLPLSGAVLALPKSIEPLAQPFIAAYWGWSGSLSTMKATAFYDAVRQVTTTTLAPWNIAAFVLLLHIIIGLALAYIGTKRTQWD
ncbi:ATP-binding cassette domain-containing protein [Phragmitibacter flavus]|uniref:ATP-binding cassette domain-containing protein n=1 Tax=Phragmitibacter flavus TaxID=2576071 RepID=A0A5R8KGS0_9BACT|nr:ATP-binding cassette domain-containing protein [Phragmitibacter flavus]TLD71514.1 ATP-binding cassette domain-containing protein [Phragmitibacter flavus]